MQCEYFFSAQKQQANVSVCHGKSPTVRVRSKIDLEKYISDVNKSSCSTKLKWVDTLWSMEKIIDKNNKTDDLKSKLFWSLYFLFSSLHFSKRLIRFCVFHLPHSQFVSTCGYNICNGSSYMVEVYGITTLQTCLVL